MMSRLIDMSIDKKRFFKNVQNKFKHFPCYVIDKIDIYTVCNLIFNRSHVLIYILDQYRVLFRYNCRVN